MPRSLLIVVVFGWLTLLPSVRAESPASERSANASPENASPARRPAAARPLAELLPASSLIYVEVADPAAVIRQVESCPVCRAVRESPIAKQILANPDLAKLPEVLANYEKHYGGATLAALSDLLGRGVALGMEPSPQPGKTEPDSVLVIRGASHEKLRHVLVAIQKTVGGLATLIPIPPSGNHAIVSLDKLHYALVDDLLVLATRKDLTEGVVRRCGSPGVADDALPKSPGFAAAAGLREPGSTVWGFVDMAGLARAMGKARLMPERSDNIVGALLAGGHAELVALSPVVVGNLTVAADGAKLSVAVPTEIEKLPASHAGLLPAAPKEPIPELRPAGTFLTWSFRRDTGLAWANREALVRREELGELANLDNFLTAAFGGKDFGQEVLTTLRPDTRIVVTGPRFGEGPTPLIKLPTAAVILQARRPEEALAFRNAFKRLIGVLSYILGEQAKADVDLDRDTHRGDPVWFIRFEESVAVGQPPSIRANFSPAVVVLGDRVALTSSLGLAKELLDLHKDGKTVPSALPAPLVDALVLEVAPALALLTENREHLIANNIATKGQTRQQAEAEIGTVLELAKLLRRAEIRTEAADSATRLVLQVQFNLPTEK